MAPPNIVLARWNVAVKEAQRIQRIMASGYMVMDGSERLTNLHVDATEIWEGSLNSRSIWYGLSEGHNFDLHMKSAAAIRNRFRLLEIFKLVKRIPR